MNYSEHGTTVDNVLYSCDFSDKKVHTISDHPNDSTTVTSVKQILKKVRKRRLESNEENRKSKNIFNFLSFVYQFISCFKQKNYYLQKIVQVLVMAWSQ